MDTSSKVVLPNKPIIFFDGVCNLCNGAVDFILRRDKKKRFVFESLQSNNAKLLLSDEHLKTLDYIVVLTPEKEILTKSNAVFYISQHLHGWVKIIYYFRFLPRVLTDLIYSLIARNRYTLFGQRDSCRLPDPNLKFRFLEGYQNN